MRPSEHDAPLHALLYRSVATPRITDRDLHDILLKSMRANSRRSVTGLLLYSGGLYGHQRLFVQWLEGPEPAVSETYGRICRDPRHSDLEVFARGRLADLVQGHRLFPHWSMSVDMPGTLPTTPAGFEAYARARGSTHPLRARRLLSSLA